MEVVQANSIREPIAPQGARQKSLRMQVYRGVELACHFWCVCGGVLLVIALCIILTSIVGRFLSGLGIGPGSLIGDNELME
ncbi:MAG: hypothetical protein AB7C98_09330, partial [Acidithiobacillus sp.]